MALSNPRQLFGVHSFAPYNRTTGEMYGIGRVIGDSSLSLTGELISLNGGSNKYEWAVEDGLITAELALTMREYPDWAFELFLGKKPTTVAASGTGSIGSIANKNGSSVVDATTGIASVAAASGDEADLKFGKYIVKAVSATEVDIFVSSDIDFQTGTKVAFEDDLLKVTASPVTIPGTGGTVALADFGLEFTGGSGSVALTTGDTAEFEVLPAHAGAVEVTVGGNGDVFPEFGAYVYAKKRGNSEMVEFDLFRVKAVGLPIGLSENAWSEASITAKAFYDSNRNGVFKMRSVMANI